MKELWKKIPLLLPEAMKKFRNRLGKNISKVLQLRIIGKGKGKETPYAGYLIESFDPFCLT